MDVKGFFIRRLALSADVRLLLRGVKVTATGGSVTRRTGGGGGGSTTRRMGGGDGGVTRSERRSLDWRKKALPPVRPNVLLLYKFFF
jgi:hypothetical protein